jgi:hypothetical protein
MIKKELRIHVIGLTVFVIAIQLMLVGSVFSQDKTPRDAADQPVVKKIRSSVDPDNVKTESMNLQIIAKTKDYHILTRHFNFIVSNDTKVVAANGKQLSLDELKVPCMATIHFEPGKADHRTAWRIIVLKTAKGATAGWSEPIPQ